MLIDIILNNQWYVLYLACIMIMSAYVQRNGLIYPLLNKLKKGLNFYIIMDIHLIVILKIIYVNVVLKNVLDIF